MEGKKKNNVQDLKVSIKSTINELNSWIHVLLHKTFRIIVIIYDYGFSSYADQWEWNKKSILYIISKATAAIIFGNGSAFFEMYDKEGEKIKINLREVSLPVSKECTLRVIFFL